MTDAQPSTDDLDLDTHCRILHLFTAAGHAPERIAGDWDLTVTQVEEVLEVYGGADHPDRLRQSLDILRKQKQDAATPPPPIDDDEEAPAVADGRKWHPGEDGRFACPFAGCDRSFTTPQGIGRHHATIHGTTTPRPSPQTPPTPPSAPSPAAAPASELRPAEPVDAGLDEDQRERVASLEAARRILSARPGSLFPTFGSKPPGPDALMVVAEWIYTGITPEAREPSALAAVAEDLFTLTKVATDLVVMGYTPQQARQMIDDLLDRLAELRDAS